MASVVGCRRVVVSKRAFVSTVSSFDGPVIYLPSQLCKLCAAEVRGLRSSRPQATATAHIKMHIQNCCQNFSKFQLEAPFTKVKNQPPAPTTTITVSGRPLQCNGSPSPRLAHDSDVGAEGAKRWRHLGNVDGRSGVGDGRLCWLFVKWTINMLYRVVQLKIRYCRIH